MDLDEIPFDTRSPSPVIAEVFDIAPTPVASTSTAALQEDAKLYKNPIADAPLSAEDLAARKARAKREARFGHYAESAAPDIEDEGPPAFELDSAVHLRPNALYLYSSSVNQLDTAAVLTWANSNLLDPTSLLGVEWINDASLVLCFTSPSHAIEGLSSLLLHPSADLANDLSTALSSLEDIYTEPSLADLRLISTYHKARPFPDYAFSAVYLRFATKNDKKVKNAASRSRFYSERGYTERPPRRYEEDRSDSSRMQRDRKQEELDALDREMDNFAAGVDEASYTEERRSEISSGRNGLLGRLSRREQSSARRRRSQSPRRAGLDDDLDAYINGQDRRSRSPPPRRRSPSLERSSYRRRSPSPRRQRSPSPSRRALPVNDEPVELFDDKAGGLRAWSDKIKAPTIQVAPDLDDDDADEGIVRVERVVKTEKIKPVKRESAVDLFDASPAKKSSGKMRGWDD